ncbi:hypothetical protein F441_20974, partial [Phytophthora nicotianae CJ01A1]
FFFIFLVDLVVAALEINTTLDYEILATQTMM